MIDVLINQVDEHNEGNILATQEFKPKVVYFIKDKLSEKKMKTLRSYYENNFKDIKVEEFIVDEGDEDALKQIIDSLRNKQILVNLTGGKRINSLILLDICKRNKVTALYIDIKKKAMYEFKDTISSCNKSFEDLEIEDIVKASGGKIVEDSSKLFSKKDLVYFAEQISNNLSLWHEHKQKLYDSNIFEHDSYEQQTIYIHIENLLNEEIKILKKYLLN